jgi:hypothetical protein
MSHSPADWERDCDSASLGLDKVTVAPAKPQPADTTPDGKPVANPPDSRGRYTPVIFIHGWTGTSTHGVKPLGAFSHRIDLTANRLGTVYTTRSLSGQFQSVPGAACLHLRLLPVLGTLGRRQIPRAALGGGH